MRKLIVSIGLAAAVASQAQLFTATASAGAPMVLLESLSAAQARLQPSAKAAVTVADDVLSAHSRGERPDVLIHFHGRADLDAATWMRGSERTRFVYNSLSGFADSVQAQGRAVLESFGRSPSSLNDPGGYTVLWLTNSVAVKALRPEELSALLQVVEISRIELQRIIEPPELEQFDPVPTPFSPVSSLSQIKVPDVWAMGYTGAGITIATIDTGVRHTHEALVDQYRGHLGGGEFDHNHHWFDPYQHNATPRYTSSHGTHVTGTSIGRDPQGHNEIGVAPGANWIACIGFGLPLAGATSAGLIACGQFLLAPTDTDGNNPDPTLAPQVINNSWGMVPCTGEYDDWYESVIDGWTAAGIVPVFSMGNATACGHSADPPLGQNSSPSNYGKVFSVGSSSHIGAHYATHSIKGPTVDPSPGLPLYPDHGGFPDLKPQVVAPGVNIRSSVASGDSDYVSLGYTGTSMSAPAVSGLMALMWQAAPCLVGDYAATGSIITQTANPIPVATGSPSDGPGNIPNQATGWGEIDAQAAVIIAMDHCAGGGSAPVIGADPGQLEQTQFGNRILTRTLTLENTGGSGLIWSIHEAGATTIRLDLASQGVHAIDDAGSPARPATETIAELVSLPPGVSLAPPATIAPSSDPFLPFGDAPIELVLDDGSRENAAGGGDQKQILWLNRFTPAASDFPFWLTEVEIFFASQDNIQIGELVDVYVYADADSNPANGATLAGSATNLPVQVLDAFSSYPVNVHLTGPGDVLIAVVNRTAGMQPQTFPAALDQSSGSQGRSWIALPPVAPPDPPVFPPPGLFLQVDFLGLPGNWMVRGTGSTSPPPEPDACESLSDVPWLSVTPDNGIIGAGLSSDVTVIFDSTELDPGFYEATLCVDSNDPVTPVLEVPVELTVLPYGDEVLISVDPESVLSEQAPGTIHNEVLTIANHGSQTGHWSLSDVPAAQGAGRGGNILLYDNGPLVTHPGAGFGGADFSAIQYYTVGLNVLGVSVTPIYEARVADDFTITDPQGWTVDTASFYAYQGDSGETSTMTSVNVRIWDGVPGQPGSTVLFGDSHTNRLLHTDFANIYRAIETTPLDVRNPQMNVLADLTGLRLLPGTYWIDWQIGGSLGSGEAGPWVAPVTVLGQSHPPGANGIRHFIDWFEAYDGMAGAPLAWPFQLHGSLGENAGDGTCEPVAAPWLSLSATSGTVAPDGGTVDVTITFDSEGLANGIHSARLCLLSNDTSGNEAISVPVTLLVSGSAIAVDPAELSATQDPDSQSSQVLRIDNTGGANLDWSITETPRQSVHLVPNHPTAIDRHAGPSSSGTSVELVLDDGSSENAYGTPAGGQFMWLNRFTPTDAQFPFHLDQVEVYFPSGTGVEIGQVIDIHVYSDPDMVITNGANLVASVTDLQVQQLDGFSTYPVAVELTEPGNVWIGVVNRTAGTQPGAQPAAIDQSPSPDDRSWLVRYSAGVAPNPPVLELPFTGLSYLGTIEGAGANGVWMIRGSGTYTGPKPIDCSSPSDLPWLQLDQTAGSTAPGGSTDVTVTFDSTGLAPGAYHGALCVESNDNGGSALVEVPVALTVSEIETDLAVSASSAPAVAFPGSEASLLVLAVNFGPNAATGTQVTLILPEGLSFLSGRWLDGIAVGDTSWDCSADGDEVTCLLDGTLPLHDFASLLEVKVDVGAETLPGILETEVTISGEQIDPNPANNQASILIEVTEAPGPLDGIFCHGFESGQGNQCPGAAHGR